MLSDGLLASADVLVADIDWRDDWSSPADVGWKAIMVNASDIAAMGGRPESFLISLVVSDGFDVEGFYDGAEEALRLVGGRIVGGDLSAGPVTVVSVTALGRSARPVLRSGAQVGDGVYVSGEVGAASRDLRTGGGPAHRRPVAFHGEAPPTATAMIDVSDGLVSDCGHIATESAVQLSLESEAIPVTDGATLDDALHGGDDYVLVACSPSPIDGWTRIGVCGEGAGVTLDGSPIEPRGWEHAL